jgi:hypothetical protein
LVVDLEPGQQLAHLLFSSASALDFLIRKRKRRIQSGEH